MLERLRDSSTKQTAADKKILTPLPLPEAIDPTGVWDEMDSFLRRYMWFPDESSYLLTELWIAWSYIKDHATSAFHLLFSGATETGKNQVLGVVYLLSHLGYATSSLKPAGLFRSLNDIPNITLCLEEFSVPSIPDEDSKGIVELLLSMISRGKHVIRVERIGNKFVPCEYALFGGVAFSTKVLYRLQEDIRNRSIICRTIKVPLEYQRPLIEVVDIEETKNIRAKLSGMEKQMTEFKIGAPKTFGRAYRFKDIYTTLAPVAKWFGKEKELESALLEQAREFMSVKRDSFTGDVVRALALAFSHLPKGQKYPTLRDIMEESFIVDEVLRSGESKRVPVEIEWGNKTRKVTPKLVSNVLRTLGARLEEERTWESTKAVRETTVIIKSEYVLGLADEFGVSMIIPDPSDPSDPSLTSSITPTTRSVGESVIARESPLYTVKEGSEGSEGSGKSGSQSLEPKRMTLADLREKSRRRKPR